MIKKDAEDVKDWLVKGAEEAPAIASTVVKDANAIVPIVALFVPGAAQAASVTEAILTAVENAVVATGTAASSNGLSVTFDQAVINDVKALIASIKKV